MKRQTRKNVFETNSSSVHTITISKHAYNRTNVPNTLIFEYGEFGWGIDTLDTPEEKASYLYTAIADRDDRNSLLSMISGACASVECDAVFGVTTDGFWETGYIDHSERLGQFVDTVLDSDDTLLRYLFGNGKIYLYNDNLFGATLHDICKNLDMISENDYIIITKGN